MAQSEYIQLGQSKAQDLMRTGHRLIRPDGNYYFYHEGTRKFIFKHLELGMNQEVRDWSFWSKPVKDAKGKL